MNDKAARCIATTQIPLAIDMHAWDGRVLLCEQAPADLAASPVKETSHFAPPPFPILAPSPEPTASTEHLSTVPATPTGELNTCEAGVCAMRHEQCGGDYFDKSVKCCDKASVCIAMDGSYAECVPAAALQQYKVAHAWNGRELHCEKMPSDIPRPAGPPRPALKDEPDVTDTIVPAEASAPSPAATHGSFSHKGGQKAAGLATSPSPSTRARSESPQAHPSISPSPRPSRSAVPSTSPSLSHKPSASTEQQAQAPAMQPAGGLSTCEAGVCAMRHEQCGGDHFDISVKCCDQSSICIAMDGSYAECVPAAALQQYKVAHAWNGRELHCEKMPSDIPRPAGPPRPALKDEPDVTDTIVPAEASAPSSAATHGSFSHEGGQKAAGLATSPSPSTRARSESPQAHPSISPSPQPSRSAVPSTSPSPSHKPSASTEQQAQAPAMQPAGGLSTCEAGVCAMRYEQCGGDHFDRSVQCCDKASVCLAMDGSYAECVPAAAVEQYQVVRSWAGRELHCEKMPSDISRPAGPPRPALKDEPAISEEISPTITTEDTESLRSGPLAKAADIPVPSAAPTVVPSAAPTMVPAAACVNETCVELGEQCGGSSMASSLSCCEGVCLIANSGYAMCTPLDLLDKYIVQNGWDGRILDCEPMIADALVRDEPRTRADRPADAPRMRADPPADAPRTRADRPADAPRMRADRPADAPRMRADRAADPPLERKFNGVSVPSAAPFPTGPIASCGGNVYKYAGELCGGLGFEISAPCIDSVCTVKDANFAACIPERLVAQYTSILGWVGTILDCEPMPSAAPPASISTARRLQMTATPTAAPSAAPSDAPSAASSMAPSAACVNETCVELGEQCGGSSMASSLSCCEGVCLIANSGYAMCTPLDLLDKYIVQNGWDGGILDCEPMIADALVRDAPRTRADRPADAPRMRADPRADEPRMRADRPADAPRMRADRPADAPRMRADRPADAPRTRADRPADAPRMRADRPADAPRMRADRAADPPRERKFNGVSVPSAAPFPTGPVASCGGNIYKDAGELCGGVGFKISAPCIDSVCTVKDANFAACIPERLVARYTSDLGWIGTILNCEPMPSAARFSPTPTARRLHSVASSGCVSGACVEVFDQCGGKDFASPRECCGGIETACVRKDSYSAFCLSVYSMEEYVSAMQWDGSVLSCEKNAALPGKSAQSSPDIPAGNFTRDVRDSERVREEQRRPRGMPRSAVTPSQIPSQASPSTAALDPIPKPPSITSPSSQGPANLTTPQTSYVPSILDCEDDLCADDFEQCGGGNLNVTIMCCEPNSACIMRDKAYAECLPSTTQTTPANWDGRVMVCEEMPLPNEDPVARTPVRKLLVSTDEPCSGGCVAPREQCGSAGMPSRCCSGGTRCVKKDHFYAECLSPMMEDWNRNFRGWEGDRLACGMLTSPPECKDCLAEGQQCAGEFMLTACCQGQLQCVKKDESMAVCSHPKVLKGRIGWDGAVLPCGKPMASMQ
jgi:hypothetical protein